MRTVKCLGICLAQFEGEQPRSTAFPEIAAWTARLGAVLRQWRRTAREVEECEAGAIFVKIGVNMLRARSNVFIR